MDIETSKIFYIIALRIHGNCKSQNELEVKKFSTKIFLFVSSLKDVIILILLIINITAIITCRTFDDDQNNVFSFMPLIVFVVLILCSLVFLWRMSYWCIPVFHRCRISCIISGKLSIRKNSWHFYLIHFSCYVPLQLDQFCHNIRFWYHKSVHDFMYCRFLFLLSLNASSMYSFHV